MKLLFMVIILLVGFAMLYAQAPPSTPTADQQSLITQLHAVGCQAEENAAATAIDSLRKENAQLKAQIQKLDPPKSGATKH